jgi:hypothetical protein
MLRKYVVGPWWEVKEGKKKDRKRNMRTGRRKHKRGEVRHDIKLREGKERRKEV